MLIVCS